MTMPLGAAGVVGIIIGLIFMCYWIATEIRRSL